jgi:hypothetical protein
MEQALTHPRDIARGFTSSASFGAKRLSLVEQRQKNAVRKEIMPPAVRSG